MFRLNCLSANHEAFTLTRKGIKMADMLKVGIIGTGGITAGHIDRLLATERARIVALCDPKPENRAARKSAHPAIADAAEFDDYRDMLGAGGLDAAVIASPHTAHADQIIACLEGGLHVLTEKPMVVTVEDATRVIEAKNKAGKVVLVSYQRHYTTHYRYIKKVVSAGELGKIEFIQAVQCQQWKDIVNSWCRWRGDPKLSGYGQLSDSASHLLDILLWATGEKPDTVWANWDYCDMDVDINTSLMFRTQSGALGSIAIIGNAPRCSESFTVTGSVGGLFFEGDELLHQRSTYAEGLKVVEGQSTWWNDSAINSADANFIATIFDGAENESTAEGALAVTALTEAIAQSAASNGKGVKVTWPSV